MYEPDVMDIKSMFFRKTKDTPKPVTSMEKDNQSQAHAGDLQQRVIEAIRQVYDPEIPVNVYDLGLIYALDIVDGEVAVKMTLTAPACPVAEILPNQVEAMVQSVDGVDHASVELVWDPPWSQERMTDEARLLLGLY